MRTPPMATLLDLLDLSFFAPYGYGPRYLQEVPDYTSPPLPSAIEATPAAFQTDAAVEAARETDAQSLCLKLDDPTACQILFSPPVGAIESGTAKIGVIFYGGVLVDPRGYSPMLRVLSDTYGLFVAVPIFSDDVPVKFGTCESGRFGMARKAFPDVEKWVLAGHSFGGVAAFSDLWSMVERNDTDAIGGLVLLGSSINQKMGCGRVNFSTEEFDWLPAASISASLDTIVNSTDFAAGQDWLPAGNASFSLTITGGNHGQFGTYDYSEREALLGQIDGNATISAIVQQRQTAEAIVQVAASSGVPLPSWNRETAVKEEGGITSSSELSSSPWMIYTCLALVGITATMFAP